MKRITKFFIIILALAALMICCGCEQETFAPATETTTSTDVDAIANFIASGAEVGTLDGELPEQTNPNGVWDASAIALAFEPIRREVEGFMGEIEVQFRSGSWGCGNFESGSFVSRVYSPITARYRPVLTLGSGPSSGFRVDSVSLWTSPTEGFEPNEMFISRLNGTKMPQTAATFCQSEDISAQALLVIEFSANFQSYRFGAYWVNGGFAQLGLPADTRFLVTVSSAPTFRPYGVGTITIPQAMSYDIAWFNGVSGDAADQPFTTTLQVPCEGYGWSQILSVAPSHPESVTITTEGGTRVISTQVLTTGQNPRATNTALNHSGGLYGLGGAWVSGWPTPVHSYGWDGFNNGGTRPYNIEDTCPRVE